MSKQLLIIDTNLTTDGFNSVCNMAAGPIEGLQSLENYIVALEGGNQSADVTAKVGAVSAIATYTFTGQPTAAQTCTVGNLVLTAVAGTPSSTQFQIGGTVSATALNLATTIILNFPNTFTINVDPTPGRINLIATVPGISGNALGLSLGNLSNVTLNQNFSGGSDGTSYTLARK